MLPAPRTTHNAYYLVGAASRRLMPKSTMSGRRSRRWRQLSRARAVLCLSPAHVQGCEPSCACGPEAGCSGYSAPTSPVLYCYVLRIIGSRSILKQSMHSEFLTSRSVYSKHKRASSVYCAISRGPAPARLSCIRGGQFEFGAGFVRQPFCMPCPRRSRSRRGTLGSWWHLSSEWRKWCLRGVWQ